MYRPKISDVQKAVETLTGVSIVSPLLKSRDASSQFDATVLFKREDLQVVRSYKIRGAYNKVSSLSAEERANGIVCASAGNHAQGVAFSCDRMKVKGVIFMPVTTPSQKVEQVKMFGGEWVEIRLEGDTFDDAQNAANQYQKMYGLTFIHPFDDQKVIEGQATIALEILSQSDKAIDYLFLPVGGGGLGAGVSSVFKELSPNTKVIGVEPLGAASLANGIRVGKNAALKDIDKFVDGAAVKQVGELNFPICRENMHDVIAVDEGKICETMLSMYNKEAIVVEPAGALSVAALSLYHEEIRGKNVVCLISGSNNDITRMEEVKERALIYQKRKHYFVVKFPQRTGALKEFILDVLGPEDDITHFEYTKKNMRAKGAAIVGIEVKNENGFNELSSKMKQRGFFEKYLNDDRYLMAFAT